ncbi:hypothetical protein [Pseudonocardia acaciae]|uniref:hypothetical protein n=1 Tax=Pseudonocardia acaciae TaxID=551276 RepID=UPI00048CB3FD|nr:hypothetical protein [Pseudonocardia acaciae]
MNTTVNISTVLAARDFDRLPAATAVLTAHDLDRLLADAARGAATDETLPGICGVMLHTDTYNGTPVLVATATDRFMLVQAHVPLDAGTFEGRLMLTNAQVTQVRAMLRPLTRRRGGRDDQVSVSTDTFTGRIAAAEGTAFSFVNYCEWFPNITKVTDKYRDTPRTDQPVTLNPKLLARAAALGRRGEYVRVEVLAGEQAPVRITIGESGVARLWLYLMPVRTQADAAGTAVWNVPTAPVFELPPVTPWQREAA